MSSRYAFITLLVLAGWLSPAHAALQVSGYYKNILLRSATVLPPAGEDYTLDLNRLRLRLRGQPTTTLRFDIAYDNELWLGSYLDTPQFSRQQNPPQDSLFNLQQTTLDRDAAFARHGLYRGYVSLAMGDVDVRLGRQRIAWGTALLWNPMDILNPLNPLQLEREERAGVDAVTLDWNYAALSRLSLVAAGHETGDSSSYAIRWKSNLDLFDISLMGGRFRQDSIAGFDFAGQLGQMGLRGEFTHNNTERDGEYQRFVVGADYSFGNTLTLALEYYFNGQGASDRNAYQVTRWLSGNVQSLGRHYLGGFFGYDFTALLRWKNYLILNLDDDSVFGFHSLVYSLVDNVDLTLGVQHQSGLKTAEYGLLQNIYYTQLQWFF